MVEPSAAAKLTTSVIAAQGLVVVADREKLEQPGGDITVTSEPARVSTFTVVPPMPGAKTKRSTLAA